jgi:Gluconate 2-dehydrogenase subunit 3
MFASVSAGIGASGHAPPSAASAVGIPEFFAKGYGTDPAMTKSYKPGDVWPLTLDAEQRATVTALCDFLLPADDLGPAASAVGVPEFMDEWVSAPYPQQRRDCPQILEGLAWLNKESTKRFGKDFAVLDTTEQSAIADDICDVKTAKTGFKSAAHFFQEFRSLAVAGYYSTQEGWKAIGFVGNLTAGIFDGPPLEVLKLLDVEQTVK